MRDADPRRSFGFRRRVILARAAAAFEAAWAALWPSLALLGLFLVASLLGLWALLPGWLHGLVLGLLAAALAWSLWRVRASMRWPDHAERPAAPGAGQRAVAPAAALARRPPVRGRRRSGDPLALAASSGTARAGAAAAAGRAAALRSAPARPLGAARRPPAAADRGPGRGRRHGAQAPAPGVRAAPRRAHGRGAGRADALGDAAALYRQAAGPARGRAPGAGGAGGRARAGQGRPAGRQRGAGPAPPSGPAGVELRARPGPGDQAVRRDRRGERRGQPGDQALGPAAGRQRPRRARASGRSRRSPISRRPSSSPRRRRRPSGASCARTSRPATTTGSPASRS